MTENEAIKNINALNAVCWDKYFYDEEFARAMAKAVKALHEIQQYRAIGTVEEFKALKEKNEPKEMDRYYCPICRHYFEDTDAYNYCPVCGQKMKPIWQ